MFTQAGGILSGGRMIPDVFHVNGSGVLKWPLAVVPSWKKRFFFIPVTRKLIWVFCLLWIFWRINIIGISVRIKECASLSSLVLYLGPDPSFSASYMCCHYASIISLGQSFTSALCTRGKFFQGDNGIQQDVVVVVLVVFFVVFESSSNPKGQRFFVYWRRRRRNGRCG